MDNYKGNHASVISSEAYAYDTKFDSKCDDKCDAAVLKADTLPKADNFPWFGGDFKIPKVLDEFVIQIDSESKIRLNEPAYEIKRIEKQVFLTQCRYIPPTNKVFIEGYIRKNIEYAVKTCVRGNAIAGTIRDTTVHVPFKVYTKVNFENKPQIIPNPPALVARYFDEKRMGKDIREADRSNIEIFNEPVFCELEWSAIYDADIDEKGHMIDKLPNEEEFQEFTDKSVVFLCLKLLQKQQVCFPIPHKEAPKNIPYPMNTEWETPDKEFKDKKPC